MQRVSDSVYNWLTVLLGNQYLTFRAPIRVYIFNFIILGVLYIVHLYTSVPYPICCIMLGLVLIIRDHKQRWRCDTDNLSGNPTLKKLTTFWYSSMRSRQLNVFYHWLHMWPSGQKLDEVRLWLVFRIYADSLFNPAYEEYKQPKHVNLRVCKTLRSYILSETVVEHLPPTIHAMFRGKMGVFSREESFTMLNYLATRLTPTVEQYSSWYEDKFSNMLTTNLLMSTFEDVFGAKSPDILKCLQGRSLTQFATRNIGCFVYELNRQSDYTDRNHVLLFVQRFQKDIDNFQLFYRDPKARRQLAKVIINRYYVDNQPFFIGANDTKRVQLKLSSNFIDRNIFTNELRLAGIMANSIKTESVIERKDIIERYVDTIINNANLRRSFETWLNQGSAYSCSLNSSATFETAT